MSQTAPVFNLNHVDEDTVLQHLLSLKTNKAIGLDSISARLLKYGARAICRSVTNLLNLSISSGKFPDVWKCSKVTALFKCGDRSNPTNYRYYYYYYYLKIFENGNPSGHIGTCFSRGRLLHTITI